MKLPSTLVRMGILLSFLGLSACAQNVSPTGSPKALNACAGQAFLGHWISSGGEPLDIAADCSIQTTVTLKSIYIAGLVVPQRTFLGADVDCPLPATYFVSYVASPETLNVTCGTITTALTR